MKGYTILCMYMFQIIKSFKEKVAEQTATQYNGVYTRTASKEKTNNCDSHSQCFIDSVGSISEKDVTWYGQLYS